MTQDEFFSTFRSTMIFVGGAAAMMGFNTITATDLQADVNHMINGAKEFMVGAGPILALGLAWWGKIKASPASQKAAVAATGALVVQTSSPVATANAIAALPAVAQVVSTQEVADATPSGKVVSK